MNKYIFHYKIENNINKLLLEQDVNKEFNAINKKKLMNIISQLKDYNFTIKNIL
jgi:hypothetical protein